VPPSKSIQTTVPTRDRILGATADLLRRKGYTGTGLKEIVKASEAPFGSIYHFFPGGKEQLGAEAIREAGKVYNALIAAFYEGARDPVAATAEFFQGAAEVLRQTDYEDACPIATVALEVASTSEPMREATAAVFESWIADLVMFLRADGLSEAAARDVGVKLFCLIEGAFILSRASKSTAAVELAGELAVQVVRDALRSTRERSVRARRRPHTVR
jgi:AcrR family transcriptional regulator